MYGTVGVSSKMGYSYIDTALTATTDDAETMRLLKGDLLRNRTRVH